MQNRKIEKEVKKAVIPIAGLGTRFFPLGKVLPKEFWPLVDLPMLQYIVEEAAASGIKEIIFVNRPEERKALDYFKEKVKSKKILESRHKESFIKNIKKLETLSRQIKFSQVFQINPKGDGDAILKAEREIGGENFAVLFTDDIIISRVPCLLQLKKVFKKNLKPVIALSKVPQKSFPSYGMIQKENIGRKIYKIKKIIEKPKINESPSSLAIVGRYILTPKILDYLKEAEYNQRGEKILGEVLAQKIKEEEVLGCEFEGKWLECGNKMSYLKSNFYLSLKHPKFGKELKKFWK